MNLLIYMVQTYYQTTQLVAWLLCYPKRLSLIVQPSLQVWRKIITVHLFVESTMAQIHGVGNMTVSELRQEVQQGGKFVVYLYCVSILILTFKRSSAIYFIRANENAVLKGLPFTFLSLLAGWWHLQLLPSKPLSRTCKEGNDITPEMMNSLNRAQAQPLPFGQLKG